MGVPPKLLGRVSCAGNLRIKATFSCFATRLYCKSSLRSGLSVAIPHAAKKKGQSSINAKLHKSIKGITVKIALGS